MKKILQFLFSIYALLIFIVLVLLLFFFVLIALPFGRIKGGNLIYRFCNIAASILYVFLGIRHKEIYEVPHNRKNQYIFIANHRSYMDIPAIVRCMHQPVRILGKHEMVKYPIFGIVYRAAVITVDRSDAYHRKRSIRVLKAAIQKGISVVIFPEGTFNETDEPLKEFYDGAFRIAIETQTPIKPLLFLDCAERLHWRTIFSLTPGKSRIVFMDEIKIEDYPSIDDISALKQKAYDMMDEGLRRYKKYKPVFQL